MVPPRGCAYVVMVNRLDSSKVLVTLKNARIHGNSLKVCSFSFLSCSLCILPDCCPQTLMNAKLLPLFLVPADCFLAKAIFSFELFKGQCHVI